LNARAGFTLAELLVAGTLTLLLLAGLAAVVDPSHATSQAQAAATDVRLRLRAASEALAADIRAAGSGPVNGVFSRALGSATPAVLPFRLGSRGDPPGTARIDAISLLSAAGVGAAAELADVFVPGTGVAQIAATAGCPAGDPSCGVRAGVPVLVVDGRGQSDLFNVTAVSGDLLTLAPRGPTSGRPFPAGSLLIPVTVVCYYLRPGTAADGLQLMAGDGDTWDLPLVDHLTGLTVELLGDPRPPRLGSSGSSPSAPTYGPTPPPVGTDDLRDDWPAGENCTFVATGGTQQSRMPTLTPGGSADLVVLPTAALTDGPWCPDGAAQNRYDADLLRVRAVRVTIRAEAASAAVRGADVRRFLHPGSSRDRSGVAADQVVVLDVVPRALQAGR
jgi:type II secretory pathway pseudopilin PulG